MQRISRGVILAAAALGLFSVVASAQTTGSRVGLGYFRDDAPVGVRVWLNDRFAFDAGLGLALRDYEIPNEDDPESKLSFSFDAGVLFALAGDDNTKFFVRPGIMFHSEPAASDPDESATDFLISGTLGVEHFFSKWFSVQAAHGLALNIHDPGIDGSDSETQVLTEGAGLATLGFHFYFN